MQHGATTYEQHKSNSFVSHRFNVGTQFCEGTQFQVNKAYY